MVALLREKLIVLFCMLLFAENVRTQVQTVESGYLNFALNDKTFTVVLTKNYIQPNIFFSPLQLSTNCTVVVRVMNVFQTSAGGWGFTAVAYPASQCAITGNWTAMAYWTCFELGNLTITGLTPNGVVIQTNIQSFWKTIPFGRTFSSPPVVIAYIQSETTIQQLLVKTSIRNIQTSFCEIQLDGYTFNDVGVATVSVLVLPAGLGYINGAPFSAGLLTGVADTWSTFNYGVAMNGNRYVFASPNADFGNGLRLFVLNGVGTNSFQVRQPADDDDLPFPTKENVGCFVFSPRCEDQYARVACVTANTQSIDAGCRCICKQGFSGTACDQNCGNIISVSYYPGKTSGTLSSYIVNLPASPSQKVLITSFSANPRALGTVLTTNLVFASAGTYGFRLIASDRCRFWVVSTLVATIDFDHTNSNITTDVSVNVLTAGTKSARLECRAGFFYLQWKKPGTSTFVNITTADFTTCTNLVTLSPSTNAPNGLASSVDDKDDDDTDGYRRIVRTDKVGAGQNNFILSFLGAVVSTDSTQTTFSYSLKVNPTSPDCGIAGKPGCNIARSLILEFIISRSYLLSSSPVNTYGKDAASGLKGLEFDQDVALGQTMTYTFTLSGVWSVGTIRFSIDDYTSLYIGTIQGPSSLATVSAPNPMLTCNTTCYPFMFSNNNLTIPTGKIVLGNHPFGTLGSPFYGLRLTNLGGSPGEYTFDFETNSTVYMFWGGSTSLRIYGRVWGGRRGSSISQCRSVTTFQQFWDIDITIKGLFASSPPTTTLTAKPGQNSFSSTGWIRPTQTVAPFVAGTAISFTLTSRGCSNVAFQLRRGLNRFVGFTGMAFIRSGTMTGELMFVLKRMNCDFCPGPIAPVPSRACDALTGTCDLTTPFRYLYNPVCDSTDTCSTQSSLCSGYAPNSWASKTGVALTIPTLRNCDGVLRPRTGVTFRFAPNAPGNATYASSQLVIKGVVYALEEPLGDAPRTSGFILDLKWSNPTTGYAVKPTCASVVSPKKYGAFQTTSYTNYYSYFASTTGTLTGFGYYKGIVLGSVSLTQYCNQIGISANGINGRCGGRGSFQFTVTDTTGVGCTTISTANAELQFTASCGTTVIDNDGDGFSSEVDCNDNNPLINPNRTDIPCNGIDEDCDGADDILDLDNDSFSGCGSDPEDCDDSDATMNPAFGEICDGKDNNCDGVVDEGFDVDGDGFTVCNGDCDDSNAATNPNAVELCDGIDNNCNGQIDEGNACCYDNDNDGVTTCQGDCNDNDNTTYPNATELCDGKDNDCNGVVDDSDLDGDGFQKCFGDCNDNDASIYPDAPELCDGKDNDCNGQVDETDADGDGSKKCFGDCNDADNAIYPGATEICDGKDNNCNGLIDEIDNDKDGVTLCAGDCNDNDNTTYPGAPELCDGKDNDCDGFIDDGLDNDKDGVKSCAGDCDDNNRFRNNASVEYCGDFIDNNCNGVIDEANCVPCSATFCNDPIVTRNTRFSATATYRLANHPSSAPGYGMTLSGLATTTPPDASSTFAFDFSSPVSDMRIRFNSVSQTITIFGTSWGGPLNVAQTSYSKYQTLFNISIVYNSATVRNDNGGLQLNASSLLVKSGTGTVVPLRNVGTITAGTSFSVQSPAQLIGTQNMFFTTAVNYLNYAEWSGRGLVSYGNNPGTYQFIIVKKYCESYCDAPYTFAPSTQVSGTPCPTSKCNQTVITQAPVAPTSTPAVTRTNPTDRYTKCTGTCPYENRWQAILPGNELNATWFYPNTPQAVFQSGSIIITNYGKIGLGGQAFGTFRYMNFEQGNLLTPSTTPSSTSFNSSCLYPSNFYDNFNGPPVDVCSNLNKMCSWAPLLTLADPWTMEINSCNWTQTAQFTWKDIVASPYWTVTQIAAGVYSASSTFYHEAVRPFTLLDSSRGYADWRHKFDIRLTMSSCVDFEVGMETIAVDFHWFSAPQVLGFNLHTFVGEAQLISAECATSTPWGCDKTFVAVMPKNPNQAFYNITMRMPPQTDLRIDGFVQIALTLNHPTQGLQHTYVKFSPVLKMDSVDMEGKLTGRVTTCRANPIVPSERCEEKPAFTFGPYDQATVFFIMDNVPSDTVSLVFIRAEWLGSTMTLYHRGTSLAPSKNLNFKLLTMSEAHVYEPWAVAAFSWTPGVVNVNAKIRIFAQVELVTAGGSRSFHDLQTTSGPQQLGMGDEIMVQNALPSRTTSAMTQQEVQSSQSETSSTSGVVVAVSSTLVALLLVGVVVMGAMMYSKKRKSFKRMSSSSGLNIGDFASQVTGSREDISKP